MSKKKTMPAQRERQAIKNEGLLFVEEWVKAFENFAYDYCGLSRVWVGEDGIVRQETIDSFRGRVYQKLIPTPKAIAEWLALNPHPKVYRDELVHQLCERVSILEAALTAREVK